MQLKEFSLISSAIKSGTVLKALETAISAQAITQSIADTDSNEERKQALATDLMICLVIAMSLWSKASMRTVLKNLVDGLSEVWIRVGQYWRVPSKSSITEARQRVGCRVMSRFFHLVVRPCAIVQTPEAFLGGCG
ncbi:transposase domain-containing protein [Nostoc parmelioides FACHB-3921]|uniref:Transposase domain-containing protein n=1 Tax=Nostoc parmelioides FACHB-3921 TaxID=2692909 RepID=A0ABR8BM37_9NOSO|nr:transposase domain-containing protein [Nostoc parmelioides FACHB-3921]